MRKKLLLADDSITIQKVVELTFPSDEFEVATAGNGRLAIDKAATFLPDMVLCDVIMPQLDGYQVCEALRAMPQLKDVPILLLNGAFEPYDSERATAVGALGNVSKPFDPPALVARVKEILAQRATAAPAPPPVEEPMPGLAVEEEVTEAPMVEEPAAAAAIHEDYAYDDSGTSPVSTIEVPMGIRELAARSLSLDAPVFAASEPEVLNDEPEMPGFSETLHGPELDEAEPFSMETAETAVERVEEAPELESLAPPVAEPEPVSSEPAFAEAEPEPAEAEAEMPQAPALDFAAPEPEAELEPALDLGAEALPKTLPPMQSPFPAEPAPAPVAAAAAPAPAPPAPPPPPAPAPVEMPAPAPVAAATEEAGAFDGLLGQQPAAPAVSPSAEVSVPVDMVQQIAQRVISQVSERVIREIAWDVIPGLAEKLVKAEIERIRARAESERD